MVPRTPGKIHALEDLTRPTSSPSPTGIRIFIFNNIIEAKDTTIPQYQVQSPSDPSEEPQLRLHVKDYGRNVYERDSG